MMNGWRFISRTSLWMYYTFLLIIWRHNSGTEEEIRWSDTELMTLIVGVLEIVMIDAASLKMCVKLPCFITCSFLQQHPHPKHCLLSGVQLYVISKALYFSQHIHTRKILLIPFINSFKVFTANISGLTWM